MVLYLKETPQLVAHNAPFDMGVLKKRLYSYGIQWMERATYLCTVQIGRSALPGMRPGLGDMCDYYGIELDHHKADSDSHAAGEILLRYMGEGMAVERYVQIINSTYCFSGLIRANEYSIYEGAMKKPEKENSLPRDEQNAISRSV